MKIRQWMAELVHRHMVLWFWRKLGMHTPLVFSFCYIKIYIMPATSVALKFPYMVMKIVFKDAGNIVGAIVGALTINAQVEKSFFL